MASVISLISTSLMFKVPAVLSIFTRERRSVIMEFSLSISWVISTMNSLYISLVAPSPMVMSESARTFMEARGVFNS